MATFTTADAQARRALEERVPDPVEVQAVADAIGLLEQAEQRILAGGYSQHHDFVDAHGTRMEAPGPTTVGWSFRGYKLTREHRSGWLAACNALTSPETRRDDTDCQECCPN